MQKVGKHDPQPVENSMNRNTVMTLMKNKQSQN